MSNLTHEQIVEQVAPVIMDNHDDSFARFDEAVTILEAIERGDHV